MMRHATPIRPVRQMYHSIECPECGSRMWTDGTCTNCRYDYTGDLVRWPNWIVPVGLFLGGVALYAVVAL